MSNKQQLFIHPLKQIPVYWEATCSEITLVYMEVMRRGVHPVLTATAHVVARVLTPGHCPVPRVPIPPCCPAPRVRIPCPALSPCPGPGPIPGAGPMDSGISPPQPPLRPGRPPAPRCPTRLCPAPRTDTPSPRAPHRAQVGCPRYNPLFSPAGRHRGAEHLPPSPACPRPTARLCPAAYTPARGGSAPRHPRARRRRRRRRGEERAAGGRWSPGGAGTLPGSGRGRSASNPRPATALQGPACEPG